MLAYHFTGERLHNGQPIPGIGEWLVHDGPIVPCESGLHASEHPYDALGYAPGPMLHLVELEGDLVEHNGDKWVGRQRRILASIDATGLLGEFARWCAWQVIDLWEAPPVVRTYLTTGDPVVRAAAGEAAWAATRAPSPEWAAAGAAQREKFAAMVARDLRA